MNRRLSLVGLALVSACGNYVWGGHHDQSLMTHKTHAENDVECSVCHEMDKSKALGQKGNLPDESTCLQCHQDSKDSGDCAKCHTDPAKPLGLERHDLHLTLTHGNHLGTYIKDCLQCHATQPDPKAKKPAAHDCLACHKDLPEPKHETVAPTMASCTQCHNHQVDFNEGRCDKCHIDLQLYPLQPVAEFAHQGNWVKLHPQAARAAGESCAKCHDQTFCSDCHNAGTAPAPVEVRFPERVTDDFLIHRGDWLSRHSQEASADPAQCSRCHGTSFCNDCHTAQNLTSAGTNPRNPHPPGWAFPGATSHATAARNDISSCQACHDQGAASVCIKCHKVGGIGGNPHPPSFLVRHNSSEIHRNSMCLDCHL